MKSPLMQQLFELEPNLEIIEILCCGLRPRLHRDKVMGWRGIHDLLYNQIGWGRDATFPPIFENTSTDPILYSSEAWCEAKGYFDGLVFGKGLGV